VNSLEAYGWNEALQNNYELSESTELRPARVIADFGTSQKIASPEIITAELSGKLAHYSTNDETPKVGDWVLFRSYDDGHAVIESLLPRRNEIARKVVGKQTRKQILAANVDIAFVLLALDKDFSVDRLRRFLFQLSSQNILSIIVLNKADKTEDVASFSSQLTSFQIPIIITIATKGDGISEILARIEPTKTAILLGSSGVGKSTITNKLLGRDAQETKEVRVSDDTGMHTTVHRELFVLANGGLLIDTPGIRELQLWGQESDLDDSFDDVTELISQCKYTSCQHGTEEGCAIQRALNNGSLDPGRFLENIKIKK
jgi:ribosome biogenesis GTPase